MTDFRNSDYELINFTFKGKADVFIGTPRVFTMPPVPLFLTGNDRRDVLGSRPRPAQGEYVKCFDLTEKRSVRPEPIKTGCTSVPKEWRFTEETVSVTGDCPYSDDAVIKQYFRPPGMNSGAYFAFGGLQTVFHQPILIIRKNTLKKYPNIYELHYYYRGVLLPTDERPNEKEIEKIKFEYLPAVGYGENGKILPPGQQTMLGWFVRILQDGTNQIVDPANPDVPAGVPDFAPFWEMGIDLVL